MIYDLRPIEMADLLMTLRGLADINHPGLTSGQSAFDDPHGQAMIERSIDDFARMTIESCDQENQTRRALAWLLNQDDDTLVDVLRRARASFPYTNPAEKRRFLELLWERMFTDWRYEIDPSDPDPPVPEIVGLPD